MPKKIKILIIVLITFGFLFGSFKIYSYYNKNMGTEKASYNTKVKFSKNQVLQFPDFSLEYLGEKPNPTDLNVSMSPIYEFRIKSEGGDQVISWSSGTGALDPAYFKTGHRKEFGLELAGSEKLGRLADDELVVIIDDDSLPTYDKPVRFVEGQVLEFPDFDLKFVGFRQDEKPYSDEEKKMWEKANVVIGDTQKITVYNFEITKDGEAQKVSGSPADFPLKFTVPFGKTKRPGTIDLGVYLGVDPPLSLDSDELVVTLGPAFPM